MNLSQKKGIDNMGQLSPTRCIEHLTICILFNKSTES